jgi:hypothetical protein
MNLEYALPLLLALGLAFYAVRLFARRRALRRQKARRERSARTGPRSFVPAKSKRSEMRTDDDPTTVMEKITESRPPPNGTRPTEK